MSVGGIGRPQMGDVVAGISVGLVVVPQAMAYAGFAGLPASYGLYAAAVAPLAAFVFASSRYLQTGPTAVASLLTFGALSSVATPFTSDYVALAALLALLVGIVRVAIGLVRAGAVAYLMSQPVIVGFTSAAGVLILASQVPGALGVDPDGANSLVAALRAAADPSAWDLGALGFVVITGACVGVGRMVHSLFPGVLVAVVVCTLASALVDYGGSVVGDVAVGLPGSPLDLPWSSLPSLLLSGTVIAVVGFAEPTAIARRYAIEDRELWEPNREFVSQGLANLASGLAGGYTVGASFSRSALNRVAGARTRWSQAITGALALAALPALGLVTRLPDATLAAIVIVASMSLIDVRSLWHYRKVARVQFYVALLTFGLTLALAPRIELAVVFGIALAIAAHLWREMRISIPSWIEYGALHVRPSGVLYFASAPGLDVEVGRLLAHHPEVRSLVVHLDGFGRIDLSGALALRDLIEEIRQAGLEVRVADVPPPAAKIVRRVVMHDDRTERP
jgi:sulfate permease, SulP family